MKPFAALLFTVFTLDVAVTLTHGRYSDRAALGARLIRSASKTKSVPDTKQMKRIHALEDVFTSSYNSELKKKAKNADSTRRSSVDETRELDRELDAIPDNDIEDVKETLNVRNMDGSRRRRDVGEDKASKVSEKASSKPKKSTIAGTSKARKGEADLMGTAGALSEDQDIDEDNPDDSEFSKKGGIDEVEKDDEKFSKNDKSDGNERFDDDENVSKKDDTDEDKTFANENNNSQDDESDGDEQFEDDGKLSKKDELNELEKDEKSEKDNNNREKDETDGDEEDDSKISNKEENDEDEKFADEGKFSREEDVAEEKIKDEEESHDDDDDVTKSDDSPKNDISEFDDESKNSDDVDESNNSDEDDKETEEGTKKSGIDKSDDTDHEVSSDKKSGGLESDEDTADTKVSCRTECAPAMDYETCAVPRCDYKVGTIKDLCQYLCHHQKEHCEEVCD